MFNGRASRHRSEMSVSNPNKIALVCKSAWGPGADRRHNRLIDLDSVGSTFGAVSHLGCRRHGSPIDSFSEVYEGDPFLVRLLLQADRFFVCHNAAVLEAAQDPSRRKTWFTVAALKQQMAV